MARYRKIDVRVWVDAKFRSMTQSSKLIWFYLLTNPETNNLAGIYRCTETTASESLGMDLKTFREGFQNLSRNGLVKADWKAGLVWVINAMRYDPPASPNVVKSWSEVIDELPECDLKTKALQHVGEFLDTKSETFREAFQNLSGSFSKPLPNPEPEPEPDNTIARKNRAPKKDRITEGTDEVIQEHGKTFPDNLEPTKSEVLQVSRHLASKKVLLRHCKEAIWGASLNNWIVRNGKTSIGYIFRTRASISENRQIYLNRNMKSEPVKPKSAEEKEMDDMFMLYEKQKRERAAGDE